MTEHQREKFDNIMSHSDKIVALFGEGGTGKTVSVSKFIQSLDENQIVALTTTTHQSLSVLRDMVPSHHKCDITTSTIHKFLGFRVKDNQGKSTLQRNPKHEISFVDYLIIDESSYLTKQLLDFIKGSEVGFRVRKKIILVGDKMQLTIDDFLNLDSIFSEELTENMRQSRDSDLYTFCHSLRHRIENKLGVVPIPANGKDIIMTSNHTAFVSEYKKNTSNKCILAFLNSTVKSYNNNIKKKMLKEDTYSIGDTLVVMEPTFKKLANGSNSIIYNNRERVEILGIVQETDSDTLLLVKNSKEIEAQLLVPKSKAEYNRTLKNYVDKKDWKNYYDYKEARNFVHHSYALTVHSAQGSTFDDVFIDLSDFNPPNDPVSDKLLRMVYVALTRARKRVFIYLGDGKRDYQAFGKTVNLLDEM